MSSLARAPRRVALAASLGLYGAAFCAVAIVLQAVVSTLRLRDVFPFYDMVLVDYRYFAASAHDFWIFRDNEHLPLFAMPLFWADLRLFGGQGLFLVLCNLLFAIGIAVAPWRAIWTAARGRRALATAACALTATLMLWFGNRANLTWPKQTHMYLSLLALMLAFRRAASERPVDARGASSIAAFLFVATFSFGYGIIGFASVGLLAIQRRWRPIGLAIIALTLLACLAAYDALSFGVGYLREGVPLLHHGLARWAAYALTFVGSPVTTACRSFMTESDAEAIGRLAASLGILVAAWHILRGFRRRPDEIEAWALLLATCTLCNAAETAFARAARFGVSGGLEYRYIVGELPFWIALVLLAVRSLASASPRSLALAALTVLAVEFGLLHSQQYEIGNQRNISPIRWQAAMAALDGVSDRDFLAALIWPTPDQVVTMTDGLRSHHLSVFAWPQAAWVGERIEAFTPVAKACDGALQRIAPVNGAPGQLVEGWVSDRHVASGSGWILLVDSAGAVVGLAHDGIPRLDLLESRRDPRLAHAGWRGYVATARRPVGLSAYLVLPGHRACRLVSSSELRVAS